MQKIFPPSWVRRWARVALACTLCTVLVACAAGKSTQKPEAKPVVVQSAAALYYVGADQLPVYSEPRSSSSRLAQLPRNQRVYRYRLEGGYAYIKVEGSALSGWVDNAKLIWRRPATQEATPAGTEEQEARPAREEPVTNEQAPASPTAGKEQEPAPAATGTPIEQKPESSAAPPTRIPAERNGPTAPPAPRPIGPSIFNPF